MILQQLKKTIDERGLKKKKVAEILGISPGHLSYILSETRDISIELENRIRQFVR